MAEAKKIKLSVLDQSPVRAGGTPEQALKETLQLAQLADQLGYTRYWVSEHHNSLGLAGPSPEVLIPYLAAHTQHLRVGSGGVMLPHYSALKVAQNFRLLEALYPNRIDLGIGRAPGTDRKTAALLNPYNQFNEQDFVDQLINLDRYLQDGLNGSEAAEVKVTPRSATTPERWLLSSSGQSGVFAAHFGMGFSFAHFINPNGGPEMMHAYQTRFSPSALLKQPAGNFGIFVLCADTEEKAEELQLSMDMLMLHIRQGKASGVPSLETAKAFYADLEPDELAHVQYNRQRMVSGTPAQVKAKLDALAEAYNVDEIVIVTITYDFQDRLRSYELLAQAYGLEPRE
ncbi:LLM class flavin-dependent oxidoreductase [Rufibacter sediminis]|uniref:LLM class flavin-dependent oxidoreductase n=1 Tax=Rufibacter sediminis TaxID=2762756 RepID=A0ABR6VRW9_9BACT|nr:LLM class flavin-dependent oxidoreductase [Rufibacter sediminis]MBC3539945.1 LLM class flavin-dependent oxidoreductase [Rufibacter sediminis]